MARNRAFGRINEDGKKTGFFKILADKDLSSESMRLIPHKFKKSVCKNFPVKVILKVVWGRSWTVYLSKLRGSYLMDKKGWEKFLKDNNLGDKEFLTFTNEGNNCLRVSIFGKSSKDILRPRKPTIIASPFSNVKKEEMSFDDPVIAESTSREVKQKERVEEEEKLKEADNNVDIASSSSSSVATFNLTIKQSGLLTVTIPQDFAMKHMPKEKTKFIIHDLKRKKSWEVVYFYKNGGQKIFNGGWRILTRDCGLAIGDFCTLRLIKPKEMVLEVLHASP